VTQPDPHPSPLLKIPEVADLLRVHVNTVYRLIQRGEIPTRHIGGSTRVHRADLDRYLGELPSRIERRRRAKAS
jgi:excisionase family DNA binding protein